MTPPASAGGSWVQTVLYNFTAGSDGGYSSGGVVIGSGGVYRSSGRLVLYGVTDGGTPGLGTVFALEP